MREQGMEMGEDSGDGGRVSAWWWGDEIFSESVASGSLPLPRFFTLLLRRLWLTVLFIGVPAVQGTHLQSLVFCTLSELREGDKERGRKRGEREGTEGAGSTEPTFMSN